jgi:hypothetical protein
MINHLQRAFHRTLKAKRSDGLRDANKNPEFSVRSFGDFILV